MRRLRVLVDGLADAVYLPTEYVDLPLGLRPDLLERFWLRATRVGFNGGVSPIAVRASAVRAVWPAEIDDEELASEIAAAEEEVSTGG